MKLDTKELKTITVLYVEDDELIRTQTKTVFEKVFKKVFTAVDGEEGLNVYTEYKDEIDIVVTDINMPKLNGLDMVEKINDITVNIPIVVTTAHTDSTFLMNAINISVDKYIAKPFQIKELTISIVESVLKYRRINNMETLAKNLVQKTNKSEDINTDLNIKVQHLETQNNYNKAIIDNFVITFKIDKNGIITDVSDKFIRFFGFSKEDILGKDMNILRCEACNQESFQKLMLKVIYTKKTTTAPYQFKVTEDKVVICDLTLTPFYNENQLVDGYTVYLDIL